MCAMKARRSVATTMGFTAVDGLMMGTRTGAIDPGVLLYLMQFEKMDLAALTSLLYKESGLLGVSGLSQDMRTLLDSDKAEAKEAVALFDAIHSVDRPSLCEALSKEIQKQGRSLTLFAQINTGAEPQKAGVLPQDADAFLAACRETYGLTMSGLMCIPPADEAPGPHFALTAKIAKRNGLKLLSMGMSADFADAIALGATHVRIGSAIFGGRH